MLLAPPPPPLPLIRLLLSSLATPSTARACTHLSTRQKQANQAALKAADSSKANVSAQLAASQAAVTERDAALDALADELVAVSGTADEQAAAREQAEEQVWQGGGEGKQ